MSASKPCNCPKCGAHFESISAMNRHRIAVHGLSKIAQKPYSWECPICHILCKTSAELRRHRPTVHGKYCYQSKSSNGSSLPTWACKYCGIIVNSRRKLYEHYKECIEKEKQPTDSRGRVINYDGLRKSQETKKQRKALGVYKPRLVSTSTRAKLRDCRKQYLATHRVKYNWTGPLNTLSYAEQYFYDIVEKRCKFIHWVNNLRISYYKLDFANLDTKVYFEVDGEQHYDEYGLYHDKQRTERLEQFGWKLIGRVRWKLFSRLSDIEKHAYIDTLLNAFMSNEYHTIDSLHDSPTVITSKRQLQHAQQLAQATLEGRVDKNGHILGNANSMDEWVRRKNLILTCGVDISKFGWVEKVIRCTGLTKRMIENTLKKFNKEFDGKYFRRKYNPVDCKP